MAYDLSKWDLHDPQRPDHPISQHTCVKIIAHIRNNLTGEVRAYHTWDIYDPDDGDLPSVFQWKENNYACDCNRGLFFARAAGEEDPSVACGDTVFSVNLANAKTGEIYYWEFGPNPS